MTPPVNDDFANATVLTGTSGTASVGDLTDATLESGEFTTSSNHHTAWWKHTATQNGLMEIRLRGATDADTGNTYLGAYVGTAVSGLVPFAYSDILNYDGEGGLTTNPVWNSIYFLITSGTTYYIQVDDNVFDSSTITRYLDWREIVRPTWSTTPLPVTGTSELATAMRNFSGTAFPTAVDSNGGIWRVPDSSYDRNGGSTTLLSDGLLQNCPFHVAAGFAFVETNAMYCDASSAFVDDQQNVLMDSNTTYQVGFQLGGAINPVSGVKQALTFTWDAVSSSETFGFLLTSESLDRDIMLYWQIGNDSGGYTVVPVGWPIRVRLSYTHSTGEYKAEMTVDGGAIWYWKISNTAGTSKTFGSFYPDMYARTGEPAWSVKYEGWGETPFVPPDDPATLTGRYAYYHDGAWHLHKDQV